MIGALRVEDERRRSRVRGGARFGAEWPPLAATRSERQPARSAHNVNGLNSAWSFDTFAVVLARALVSSLSIVLATFALVSPASAQEARSAEPQLIYPRPRVHVFADLSYERAPNAQSCPDEQAFRRRVRAWMAIDSFEKNPRGAYVGRVRVQVSQSPGGFAVSTTWVDAEGATSTKRFTVKGTTEHHCRYAVEDAAMSLAGLFALAEMDLGAKLARRAPKLQCPPPQQPVESNYSVWPREPLIEFEEKSIASKPRDRFPLAVRIGAAVWPELIAAGRGSVGITAELGARYSFLSVGAELHGNPPLDSRSFPGVVEAVSFARLSGTLLLCGHYSWFVGCGVGDVGRIFFPSSQKLPASTLYRAVGVRVGVEFPVAPPRFFLRIIGDLRAPILPKSYTLGATTVFQPAGLGVSGGLGFVVELDP